MSDPLLLRDCLPLFVHEDHLRYHPDRTYHLAGGPGVTRCGSLAPEYLICYSVTTLKFCPHPCSDCIADALRFNPDWKHLLP